jgi:hypothetical protein
VEAPYTITEDFIHFLKLDKIFVGTISEEDYELCRGNMTHNQHMMTSNANTIDPYAIPRSKGILEVIASPMALTGITIPLIVIWLWIDSYPSQLRNWYHGFTPIKPI